MEPKETAKRFVALLLALIMTLMCCACSGSENTPTGGGNSGTSGGNTHTDGGEGKTTEAHRPEDNSTDAPASGNETPEKTIKLEKCESTGEVGFDKIYLNHEKMVYFIGNEAVAFPFKYDNKNGFINDKGEIILKNKWDNASVFSEGKAFVKDDDGWHIIDVDGNVLFTTSEDMFSSRNTYEFFLPFFKNGIAIINKMSTKAYGYYVIDSDFNIKKYMNEQIYDFSKERDILIYDEIIGNESFVGYSLVEFDYKPKETEIDMKVKFYGMEDNLISELLLSHLKQAPTKISIGDSYAKIPNKDMKYAIVDIKTGKFITEYDYNISDIGLCSDGVIPVCAYDKWGLIDTDGNELIKPKYAYLSAFSHGLGFAFDFEGNGLLINKKGETVAVLPDEIFSGDDSLSVESFTDSGFTFVSNHNKKGFLVNEKGEIIFSGEAKSFKYISAGYVVYGSDLYKIVAE